MPLIKNKNKIVYAVLALIIANIIWGAAAPIFKWSLQSAPPFTLAFLRFFIAALIVLPFAYKNLAVRAKDIIPLIAFTALGITLNISFFFLGLEKSDSINAPIIASSGPIFIIIFAYFFLKEKISKREILGGILGLLGVFLIVVAPILENGFDGSIEGNIFYIIAMLGSVGGIIILKKIIKNYNPITLVFWSFVLGSISFYPFFQNEVSSVGFLPNRDIQTFVGIIFGAVFSSAIAYLLHAWALKYMPAGETGIFTYIDPVVAVLIAAPLIGEQPSSVFFAGSFLVFSGIYIAEGRIHYHPIHLLTKR